MADRPVGMLLAALFFAVLVLAACTTFATFVRLRRQRHMMRRIGPIVDMPPSPGLRTAGSEAEEGESRRARANGELAATAAAAAGDRNSRMAQAQARAAIELAAQIRIAELQMADEERALTHAIEASLSNRPDEEQTDGSTTVMQQALEASIVTSILALPTQTWSQVREQSQDDEECALCMEPFVESDEVRVLKCRHYFHTKCIDEWLLIGQKSKSRSCPMCQMPLS